MFFTGKCKIFATRIIANASVVGLPYWFGVLGEDLLGVHTSLFYNQSKWVWTLKLRSIVEKARARVG